MKLSRSLFFVIPCFNEASGIAQFFSHLDDTLSEISDYDRILIVFIDDGSTDETSGILRKLKSKHLHTHLALVFLTRNFGHQAAVYAGLTFVRKLAGCQAADTVVIMDADGEHPPALVPRLARERTADTHHVQMLRSDPNPSSSGARSSLLYYKLFRFLTYSKMPNGSADFRAISGYLLQKFLELRESPVLNRAAFDWLGFRTKFIHYDRGRRLAGRTRYTISRRLQLALQGVTYFSARPLMITLSAIILFGFSICGLYLLIEFIRISHGATFSAGWPTTIFIVSLWGALHALGQLLLGVYIAAIFEETKQRPAFVIERIQSTDSNLVDAVHEL